ncbi:MAG TPA: SsrA-binding protein SmpB [Verrucomicrobiae bacterium]|nr:SsrA-binding protein SmpB [Verrucomicrobiae bacterium]
MIKKKKSSPGAILNRRARFDYQLGDELSAGIELTGPEVRAARDGHVQLKGAFISVKGGELWLSNASFSVKPALLKSGEQRTVDTRPRRLLLHRKQIDELIDRRQSGFSIVPLRLLTSSRFIKVVISLGKGKKNYDKRETIKRRDQEREAKREIKLK